MFDHVAREIPPRPGRRLLIFILKDLYQVALDLLDAIPTAKPTKKSEGISGRDLHLAVHLTKRYLGDLRINARAQ